MTKQQQKIIYISLTFILALGLFLFLVYFPQSKRLKDIRGKLKSIEGEIAQVESLSHGKSLAESVQFLNMQMKERLKLLPPVAEDVLKNFSAAETKYNIEVTERSLASAEVVPQVLEGYVVRAVPMTMHLRGQFRDLAEYAHALRNSFPALVRLQKLILRGGGPGLPKIDADVSLVIYTAEKAG